MVDSKMVVQIVPDYQPGFDFHCHHGLALYHCFEEWGQDLSITKSKTHNNEHESCSIHIDPTLLACHLHQNLLIIVIAV